MGRNAPSNRDAELRIEKLFLRRGLIEKFESGWLLELEDFVSFIWHNHPNYVSDLTERFLGELVAYQQAGKPYTQDDWVKFCDKTGNSNSSKDIVLSKLLYLGLIEKHNTTQMRYEIRLSHKWIQYLEYLAQSWVGICENGKKVKR